MSMLLKPMDYMNRVIAELSGATEAEKRHAEVKDWALIVARFPRHEWLSFIDTQVPARLRRRVGSELVRMYAAGEAA